MGLTKAGPFDLGKVIVRAKTEIDPTTAQLTITTDPSGPYAIPHILDGIPLEIRHVNVSIDRPDFTFNPRAALEATLVFLDGERELGYLCVVGALGGGERALERRTRVVRRSRRWCARGAF